MRWLNRVKASYTIVTANSLADKLGEVVEPTDAARLEKQIRVLEEGIKAKQIYNVDWNDAKERISRSYETYIKKLFPSSWEARLEGLQPPYSIVHYPSFLKKWELGVSQGKPGYSKITDKMGWWADVSLLIQEAKPYIVKGRKPNPAAVKVYTPPASATEDLVMVENVIKELLRQWYQQQVEFFENEFRSGAKKVLAFYENPEWVKEKLPGHLLAFQRFVLDIPSRYDPKTPKLVNDEKFRSAAEIQTKQVQDFFLNKQKAKLTSIVGKKGSLKEVKADRIKSRGGVLEGTIHFEFENGDKFLVRNQVISKMSRLGKWFNQFPTTFHDIELGGQRFKKQSEEWMNNVFAATSSMVHGE